MTLEGILRDRSLVACVGSGGVGKTSVAAALGLQAARQGRRVLVLTIDPARRLADALGLRSIGNEEHPVVVEGLPPGGGLWALMLDTRSTFDDLIRRISPDAETRDRILGNNIYQIISDAFGTSQAYMATEKLYDVHASGRYDLVVLDTPPVKNALDFLESPGRLARFLDRHILKWFLRPYDEKRVFSRMVSGTSAVVFRLLGAIFGKEFLTDLTAFLAAFKELYEGFRERHEAVLRLFSSPRTAFVVVCAPQESSVEVAGFFCREFAARDLPFAGIVVNRIHLASERPASARDLLGSRVEALAADLPGPTVPSLLARLDKAHERLRSVARQEQALLPRIEGLVGRGQFLVRAPRLDESIHNLDGLEKLDAHLFGGAPPSTPEVDP